MSLFEKLNMYVFPFVNFGLFLAIVGYFARKPLKEFFTKQALDFDSEFKTAQATLETANSKRTQVTARLAGLDKEIEKLRENSISAADKAAQDTLLRASQQAAAIAKEADKLCSAEISRAAANLRSELSETVVRRFSDLAKTKLTPEDHAKILERGLQSLRDTKRFGGEQDGFSSVLGANTGSHTVGGNHALS